MYELDTNTNAYRRRLRRCVEAPEPIYKPCEEFDDMGRVIASHDVLIGYSAQCVRCRDVEKMSLSEERARRAPPDESPRGWRRGFER